MMDDTTSERRINWPAIGAAAVVLIAAAGAWYYFHTHHAPPPEAAASPESAAPPAVPESAIQHPLPQAEAAGHGPLPPLADSDGPFKDELAKAVGGSAVSDYLVPENLIRRLVVTVDNLPRQKVAVDKRAAQPLSGSFAAQGDEQRATLDAHNYARYRPLAAVVSNLDVKQVVAVYVRYYPLFQQAYQDLGYPNGYFNDRLVQTIDSLLATPDPREPLELVRPNVMYLFADPTLEAKPAGQKLLIRMGPENRAAIKAKLTELRAAVTALPPKP